MSCAVAEPITKGQEAFVPPANFAEFYDRYPQMVRWWLHRKMRCPTNIIQDYEQSLLVHLMGRSENMEKAGIPDRIATYKPGEATYNPWGAWVSYVCGTLLKNEYIKLLEKESRKGVERWNTTVSIPTSDDEFRHLRGGGYMDLTPGQIQDFDAASIRPSHATTVVSSLFWSGFVTYVDDRAPEITPVLRALEDHDSFSAACVALGVGQAARRRYRDELLVLLKNYCRKRRR